jgi:hypothetical protein
MMSQSARAHYLDGQAALHKEITRKKAERESLQIAKSLLFSLPLERSFFLRPKVDVLTNTQSRPFLERFLDKTTSRTDGGTIILPTSSRRKRRYF